MILLSLRASINTYIQGKKWYWYVPVWFFGLFIFVSLLSYDIRNDLPFIISVGSAFNFILHEMAHLLTSGLPSIVTASAGSISELLLGLGLIIGAFAGRTYFASLFCFLWFMLSSQSAAGYMADARSQSLQLVSLGGGDPIHDWNFVFTKLGLLEQDTVIAGFVRGFGICIGLFGLVFTAWLIIRMMSVKPTPSMTDEEAKVLHETALSKGLRAAPPEHFKNVKSGSIYPTATSGRLADSPPNTADKTNPKD